MKAADRPMRLCLAFRKSYRHVMRIAQLYDGWYKGFGGSEVKVSAFHRKASALVRSNAVADDASMHGRRSIIHNRTESDRTVWI